MVALLTWGWINLLPIAIAIRAHTWTHNKTILYYRLQDICRRQAPLLIPKKYLYWRRSCGDFDFNLFSKERNSLKLKRWHTFKAPMLLCHLPCHFLSLIFWGYIEFIVVSILRFYSNNALIFGTWVAPVNLLNTSARVCVCSSTRICV